MEQFTQQRIVNESNAYLGELQGKIEELESMRAVKQYQLLKEKAEKTSAFKRRVERLRYDEEVGRFYEDICYQNSDDASFEKNLDLRCQVPFGTLLIRGLLEKETLSYSELQKYHEAVREALQERVAYRDDVSKKIPLFPIPIYLDPKWHEVEMFSSKECEDYVTRNLREQGVIIREDGAFTLSDTIDKEQLEAVYGINETTPIREACAFTSEKVKAALFGKPSSQVQYTKK